MQREAKTKEICSLLSEYLFLIPKGDIAKNNCIIVTSYNNKNED